MRPHAPTTRHDGHPRAPGPASPLLTVERLLAARRAGARKTDTDSERLSSPKFQRLQRQHRGYNAIPSTRHDGRCDGHSYRAPATAPPGRQVVSGGMATKEQTMQLGLDLSPIDTVGGTRGHPHYCRLAERLVG